MNARLLVIAATLAVGTAAAAEPAKPHAAAAAPASTRPVEVVLASADTVRPVQPGEGQSAAPVKRRAARVTTCRCGDPQPDAQAQQ
jgi:hypothetical protein